MANTNINWTSMSDKSIIETIGSYIKQQRLNQNKTQAQTAEHAGVNRWTISQIENGEAISLTSLVQILRALDLLHVFNSFKIETQISPLELAKLEKQKRQRARNSNNNNETESEW
ncbi:helix-turn-helix domain-containing protein [Thalassobellus sediminis]|uniref:helix-turn-helix domain-containing protein n=1 Tax=Thalassobellus sediminis TaxID=3367753 RepID=UPI0037B007A3